MPSTLVFCTVFVLKISSESIIKLEQFPVNAVFNCFIDILFDLIFLLIFFLTLVWTGLIVSYTYKLKLKI